MKKYIVLLCGLFLLVAAGCASPLPATHPESAMVVTDSMNHEERMQEPPKRVVILSPTLADMYHAVGGEFIGISYMPGRPYPDYVMNATSVGLPHTINMEKLIGLKPDMVIGMTALHGKYKDVLSQNHIPYLFFKVATYDDVKETLRTMAQVAGKEKEGGVLLSDMDRRMEEVAKAYDHTGMTYAAIHGTGQGVSLEAKGSIVCDVADRLGMQNVFSELSMKDISDKPPFSMEELAVRDPDVLFLTTMVAKGEEEAVFEKALLSQPAFRHMKAVKNHRVYFLPQTLFLSSPGASYPDALAYMGKTLKEK